jgi:hypothetical protein
MKKRVDRKKTFGYWLAFSKCNGVVFRLGGSSIHYKFIEECRDYYAANPYDYTLVIVVREVGKTNYKVLRYDDIKDKEMNIAYWHDSKGINNRT